MGTEEPLFGRDYILFVVGCETGLRVGDLLKLTTKQILDLKGKQHKPSGSMKAKRKVYEYAQNVQSPYLFPFRKRERPITPTQAYRQLNKAAEFAGVEHVSNHTLRKTFGYGFTKPRKILPCCNGSCIILTHPFPCVISALRKKKQTTY